MIYGWTPSVVDYCPKNLWVHVPAALKIAQVLHNGSNVLCKQQLDAGAAELGVQGVQLHTQYFAK